MLKASDFGMRIIDSRRFTDLALAILLVLSAVWSRYTFQETESRFQIFLLWIFAFVVEWGLKPTYGTRPDWRVFLAICFLAAGAVIAVRSKVEGLCPHTWPDCSFHRPIPLLRAILR